MMSLNEIRMMPTARPISSDGAVHESIFRSYHIVQKVRELLEAKTPHGVILEIVTDLQNAPKEGRL